MRKYRNITDNELAEFGVVREWDESIAHTLKPGTNLIWVHHHQKQSPQQNNHEQCFIRTVEIIKINDFYITTNFGKYSLQTGMNVHRSYRSIRPCDCYGRLYFPEDQARHQTLAIYIL